MTNAALRGKPDAGNPHVRFDEGEVALAATPRRGSLLYKYINLRIGLNNTVELERACSHGNCDQKLKGDENYCPKCGSPLKKLPSHLDKEAIIALVNENIDKLPKSPKMVDRIIDIDKIPDPPKMVGRIIDNDHCSTTGGTEDHDGWTVTSQEQASMCPHGKGLPKDCGFCTRKGACTFTVLTSMPPKYNMCPYCGTGYIDCSEAE